MENKTAYEADFEEDVSRSATALFQSAAADGLQIGAMVQQKKYKKAVFRITEISVQPAICYIQNSLLPEAHAMARLSLYGQQLRKDGSFGTHVHWIGGAVDVIVLAPPSDDGAGKP